MTNLERVFYMIPGCNVVISARIAGNISEPELCRSIEEVRRMHPLIGAKIVFDERHDAWFSHDNVPPLPLRIVKRKSDTQWFSEVQDEQRAGFLLEQGPLIRFVLVYSPEVSDLVIICNHGICDGMALANLVRDILERYSHPEKAITAIPAPDIMDILPCRKGFSIKRLISGFFTVYGNSRWRKSPHCFSDEDYVAITKAYWDKREYRAALFELGPEETTELTVRCRKEGITIGSAVTTAFIAAHENCAGAFSGHYKTLSIPFDLRRHATHPVGDVFCLCVGGAQFPFTYNGKRSFWENAAVLHKEIHKRVKNLDSAGLEIPGFYPPFIDAFASYASLYAVIPEAFARTSALSRFAGDSKNIAFSFANNFAKMSPGIIPSNLGKLSIPDTYGDLRLDRMVFLPAVSETVPLITGGISIGERTVFSLMYPEPIGPASASRTGEIIRIRNRALELLGFSEKMSSAELI